MFVLKSRIQYSYDQIVLLLTQKIESLPLINPIWLFPLSTPSHWHAYCFLIAHVQDTNSFYNSPKFPSIQSIHSLQLHPYEKKTRPTHVQVKLAISSWPKIFILKILYRTESLFFAPLYATVSIDPSHFQRL